MNDFTKEIPTLFGSRTRRVSDMGFPKIGYQTFKLLAYQRLHEMARHWEERYPGVDIVLIEPEPDDELMFQTNILNYASRLEVARHGFQSVTVKLAADYERPARDLPAPRHRDLGDARAQGRAPLRRRAREDARLAADPRADHRHAAAPVGGVRDSAATPARTSSVEQLVRVLLVDDVALDLQRRRQLARLLREVVVEDREALDLLDAARTSR